MEEKFKVYVTRLVSKLDCSETEKADIAEEMYDHLEMLKQEFLEQGVSENQAVALAISAFGKEEKIGADLQDVLFPYLKFVKWGGSLICILLAFLLIKEGVSLLSRAGNIDGTGTGVYFLIFEINDRVPEQNIAFYTYGFFVASLLTALMPFVFFNKKFLRYITSVWSPV